jgi:tubulin--tyrosine ligase-like protein 12
MWRYNQTYNIGNAQLVSEAAVPLWYIMDEFGSRIQHSDTANVRLVPFCYIPTQSAYSVMFPICDIDEGDEVTRDYVYGRTADPLTRKLLLLPWQPDDMSHLSYEQHEDDELFVSKYCVHETLPNVSVKFPELPRDRNIRIFSDIEQVNNNLTDARFEIVSSANEADIIWTRQYLKDFKAFSEETPAKFISQFPFEMVLTVKSVLPVVCRRDAVPAIDPETLDTFPLWLPTTFNLESEVSQFVSYFQHREARGLDNHWICKPFCLARGLDSCVTNSLACIIRQSESGPKIVSKYVEDPVLLDRDDVGLVKFDLRFVVMLTSVCPLEVAVHQKFIVRVANKIFSLDHLDEYEKHFTVMNYRKGAQMKQIRCDQFIPMFDKQYADVTWEKIQGDIHGMIRKVFEAAVSLPPPKGIGHSPQSRAIYGIDVMLKWHTAHNTGERSMLPVILEVNFGPDNTRLVRDFPNFYNDLFSTLFFGDVVGRTVTTL